MIVDFKDFEIPESNSVVVTGAGPSLNKFINSTAPPPEIVIGVNYTYKIAPCDYLLVTHGKLIFEFMKGIEHLPKNTTLVYSSHLIDFMFRGPKSPPAPGIRFIEYEDLYCGSSTIIPAIHLACLMSKNVFVYGMDLKQVNGKQYVDNYPTPQQGAEVFNEWAAFIEKQIAHMKNHMGLEFEVII